MASLSPEEIKKQANKPQGKSFMPFLFSLLFIAFGALLILKSLNIQYAVLQNSFIKYLPEQVMLIIAGIGSVFGGLYLIYKKYIFRQRIVYRG